MSTTWAMPILKTIVAIVVAELLFAGVIGWCFMAAMK
jgi:hypothetical protein